MDGPTLFFVNETGKLQTLLMDDHGWKLGTVLPGKPRVGTPLSTAPTDEGLLVFYLGQDNQLHYLIQDPALGEWQGAYQFST